MGNSAFFGVIFTKNFKEDTASCFYRQSKNNKNLCSRKVKIFIEKNLLEELKYFQKKIPFKIEILSDEKLIIPEYKIDLLNKSKKIINTIENINKIVEIKKLVKETPKGKKSSKNQERYEKKENKIKIKNSLGEKKEKKLN